jgi:hypothetical protein
VVEHSHFGFMPWGQKSATISEDFVPQEHWTFTPTRRSVSAETLGNGV